MPLNYSIGVAIFSCLALLSIAACKEEENTLLKTSDGKLAAIDAGTTRINDDQVRPYTILLTQLEAKCDDNRNGISDTAVQAKNIFQSKRGGGSIGPVSVADD